MSNRRTGTTRERKPASRNIPGSQHAIHKTHPRVVIVGGGLGGVTAARDLRSLSKDFEILLFDAGSEYVFKPLLYEWLNGVKAATEMKKLFPENDPVKFTKAWVSEISVPLSDKRKMIETTEGEYEYDYLILAPGARTDYFGIQSAPEYALKLENMRDTMNIMKSVQQKLTEAESLLREDPADARLDALLNFVIIGGGPTGIELAFDMKYFLDKMVRLRFPGLEKRPPRLMIFEAGPQILSGFGEREQDYVLERLKQHGIQLQVKHRVIDIQPASMKVRDTRNAKDTSHIGEQEEIVWPVVQPIWVAGVRGNIAPGLVPGASFGFGQQRVEVTPYLELPTCHDVYVIGDGAAAKDPDTGKPFPMTGQVAQHQAHYVIQDIRLKQARQWNQRKPFRYQSRGHMLSLGPGDGLITVNNPPKLLGFMEGWMLKGWLSSRFRHWYYARQLRK